MQSALRSFGFFLSVSLFGATDHLATVRSDLQRLAVDKTETWRVRDLELSKGDVKIFLSEGVLAFATPVDGRRIAAVFTTQQVEAGDAELIAFPPFPAERASLARFAHSPNLDEHFSSALLFFADNTAQDLLRQIHEHPLHPAPELAVDIGARLDNTLRLNAAEIDVRIAQSILDRHSPADAFFYGMLAGRTLGPFDFVFQPDQPDLVTFGQISATPEKHDYYQIWSAYRPRSVPEPKTVYHLTDYRIDTTVHPDLSMSSIADFDYRADSNDGAIINLTITPRLRVTSAVIDGKPASVVMHDSPRSADVHGALTFLLVNETEMPPGSHHHVQVQYEGSVIRRMPDGKYFVDDRNVWYPFMTPMLTSFDLTFHCPENLRLVSTGDPVSEDVLNGQRTVHRRTARAQVFAGFNLGDYKIQTSEHPPYRIELCSNPQMSPSPDLAEQTGQILDFYTSRWMPLPSHSLSVTPIEGYFGQGFPGLIYLSSISYLRERDRPLGLRNASLNVFFSQLLLPHEIAHQWWGNIVTSTDYRSNWILEALSNYAALEYLAQVEGTSVLTTMLTDYRADLIRTRPGDVLVDSFGPVTFDQRLLTNFGPAIWHDILYEKGTWIFHMLQQRMGPETFHRFEQRLLKDFADRPISNEDLRKEAALFIPAAQRDRNLTAFFDTWVYDTGIPKLAIKHGKLSLTEASGSYTVDLPLDCGSSGLKWVRATEGETPLPAKNCKLPPTSAFLYQE